jgi:hypothetical protein
MAENKKCECGCGGAAPLALTTNRKWGHVKGKPVHFIKGHHNRGKEASQTIEELAWLAGLLEGEGSFFLRKLYRRPKNSPAWTQLIPHIQVGMTDHDVVKRVADLMGVGVTLRSEPSRRGKAIFATALSGWRADRLMRRLLPMMGKRRSGQIKTALEGQSLPRESRMRAREP